MVTSHTEVLLRFHNLYVGALGFNQETCCLFSLCKTLNIRDIQQS